MGEIENGKLRVELNNGLVLLEYFTLLLIPFWISSIVFLKLSIVDNINFAGRNDFRKISTENMFILTLIITVLLTYMYIKLIVRYRKLVKQLNQNLNDQK
jgi:hypothetical protein